MRRVIFDEMNRVLFRMSGKSGGFLPPLLLLLPAGLFGSVCHFILPASEEAFSLTLIPA